MDPDPVEPSQSGSTRMWIRIPVDVDQYPCGFGSVSESRRKAVKKDKALSFPIPVVWNTHCWNTHY